jgi:hypothetical protein
MSNPTSAILIGLDPSVVEYEKWPGLTAEKLRAAMAADQERLRAVGCEATVCFVDRGQTAVKTLTEALRARTYDVVLIGAGVRTDPENFLLFEQLLNAAHQLAPKARLCFNTGPTDSLAAVQRWLNGPAT